MNNRMSKENGTSAPYSNVPSMPIEELAARSAVLDTDAQRLVLVTLIRGTEELLRPAVVTVVDTATGKRGELQVVDVAATRARIAAILESTK